MRDGRPHAGELPATRFGAGEQREASPGSAGPDQYGGPCQWRPRDLGEEKERRAPSLRSGQPASGDAPLRGRETSSQATARGVAEGNAISPAPGPARKPLSGTSREFTAARSPAGKGEFSVDTAVGRGPAPARSSAPDTLRTAVAAPFCAPAHLFFIFVIFSLANVSVMLSLPAVLCRTRRSGGEVGRRRCGVGPSPRQRESLLCALDISGGLRRIGILSGRFHSDDLSVVA